MSERNKHGRGVWFMAGVLAGTAVTFTSVAQVQGATALERHRAVAAQIKNERQAQQHHRVKVQRQIRNLREVSVQDPVFEQVKRGRMPRGGTIRKQLRRERAARRYERAVLRSRLTAWQNTVPRTPRWFVHQAIRVASCESGLRWYLNVGLFDGGLQFHPSTWQSVRRIHPRPLPYWAYEATPREQIEGAYTWHKAIGSRWAQTAGWPVCGKRA